MSLQASPILHVFPLNSTTEDCHVSSMVGWMVNALCVPLVLFECSLENYFCLIVGCDPLLNYLCFHWKSLIPKIGSFVFLRPFPKLHVATTASNGLQLWPPMASNGLQVACGNYGLQWPPQSWKPTVKCGRQRSHCESLQSTVTKLPQSGCADRRIRVPQPVPNVRGIESPFGGAVSV